MKRGLRGWLQDLAIIAFAVALGLSIVLSARGEGQEDDGVALYTECRAPACVIVPGALFFGLVKAHNEEVDEINRLKAELAKLRDIKGCAKLEVTEPPRNFVPKKERDS